jgi:hypothetical protein
MTTSTKEATENTDIEALEAVSTEATLSDGTVVEIERLKTRQLFRLLKVLTVGAADVLPSLNFSADMDPTEFGTTLIAALVFALPNAENEAIDFIQSMVLPKGLIFPGRGEKLSGPELEINEDLVQHLREVLANPEIEDTVAIFERVITIEAPHIQSLVKQLSLLWTTQRAAFTAKQGGSSKKSSKS